MKAFVNLSICCLGMNGVIIVFKDLVMLYVGIRTSAMKGRKGFF